MKSKNKVVSKNNTKRLLLDVADIMKNPLTSFYFLAKLNHIGTI